MFEKYTLENRIEEEYIRNELALEKWKENLQSDGPNFHKRIDLKTNE